MRLDAQSSRYVDRMLTNTRGFTCQPQIYTLEVPFPEVPRNAVSSAICDREYNYPRPGKISYDPLWQLVKQCMAYKPRDRPNAARVKALLAKM